jgi:hypothetical protein
MVITLFQAFLATTIVPVGGTVTGPDTIEIRKLGVELPVPAGWTATLAEEAKVVLGKGKSDGAVFVGVVYGTTESLRAGFSKPHPLGPVTLQPALEEPVTVGGMLSMRYHPPYGENAAYAIGRVNDERVLTAIGIVRDTLKMKFAAETAQILAAAKFGPIPPSPFLKHIAGRRFTDRFTDTIGGLSTTTTTTRITIEFCRDGRFSETDSSRSHSPANRASNVDMRSRSKGEKTGRWSLRDDKVRLQYDDGEVKQRRVYLKHGEARLGASRASGASGC